MAWLTRAIDRLDLLLSWWDRLSKSAWIKWGVGTVTFYLFSTWAWLAEQALIVHVTVALTAAASVLSLFTFLPTFLRKLTYPSFEVSAPEMLSSARQVWILVSVINRSPKSRMILDFAVCCRSKNQGEIWFLEPDVHNINQGLGPQERTEGMIVCNLLSIQDDLPEEAEILLSVADRISARSGLFKVPGSYPARS